jgi:predicted nucleic acid-binding protein
MELIKKLNNKKIFLDTAPLIYYIEEDSRYANSLNGLFAIAEKQQCFFVSSVITLIEVMTLPLREGNKKLAKKYENILTHSSLIEIIDINTKIAGITAQLRAKYSLKTPDAIQLATAINYPADYFLTNDKRLRSIKEIPVITLDDFQ